MRKQITSTVVGLLAISATALAFAQTPAPTDSTTSPSAASSPQQRDTTSNPSSEAPVTNGTDPAAASTPAQQQAIRTASSGSSHSQMMKDCITQQQSNDSSMTKDQAKKACKEQMKAQK